MFETRDANAYELQRMSHVVPLANLMLAACRFNGLDCAAGLVTCAQIMAGEDPGKSSIASADYDRCLAQAPYNPERRHRAGRLRSFYGRRSVTQARSVQGFLSKAPRKEFSLAKAVGAKSVHRYIFQLINNPFFVRRRGRCRRAHPIGEAPCSIQGKAFTVRRKRDTIPIREGTAEGQHEMRTVPEYEEPRFSAPLICEISNAAPAN